VVARLVPLLWNLYVSHVMTTNTATAPLAKCERESEGQITTAQVAGLVAQVCPAADFRHKRVLVIVPDGTRSGPVGLVFKTLYSQVGEVTDKLDVLIALGTHQPMSEAAICRRLEILPAERAAKYRKVAFHNHAWSQPTALQTIGSIPSDEISRLTGGLFAMDVPIEINRLIFEYDQLIIIGPVFPHEVVGFSGGNKYLFPGISGPRILNFFHWLGAVVTNPMIIGNKWTPVRRVVDRAGAMVALPKICFCLVAERHSLAGIYAGTPESAWDAASELSRRLHIIYKDHPFKTILSCAPAMYDELWTGGKCMYKLEPVLADGGELIIYAPHIREICVSHHKALLEIGYHCRDYFLKQWDRFKDYPWGVLAHSTHVFGLGSYENGVETPRARVTLATGIPEDVCRRINLGYRDPATIRKEEFANRESEGVLLVPEAGEMLYHLKNPPSWAGGVKTAVQ
jgi:lactate racemase